MIFRHLLVLMLGYVLAGPVAAGSLDAPAVPNAPGSAMYTLQNICDRLNDGADGAKRGAAFVEPSAGPIAGTMCTLDAIMAAMPTLDGANGAGSADVLAGKTFWGLASGAWGVQTGTATAGSDVTGTNGQLVMTIPNGLYAGSKTATASDTALTAANIKFGVDIFGVTGTAVVATGDAVAGEVLAGKTFSNASGAQTGALPTQTLNAASVAVPAGYYAATTLDGVDSDLAGGNIKSGVSIFGVAGTYTGSGGTISAPFPVAKTGQTTSYSTGDDGALQKGVAWPNPRFADNNNGTVTDNLTGLVWLKDANCAGTKAWTAALVWAAALASGQTCANANLSDGSVAGQWRLPTIKELSSLVNAGASNPALPAGHPFVGVQSYYYWSSTTHASSSSYAWYVSLLDDGYVGAGVKTYNISVWPVRGGQ